MIEASASKRSRGGDGCWTSPPLDRSETLSHHPFVDEHHVRGGPDDPMSGETMLRLATLWLLAFTIVFATLELAGGW